MAEMWTSSGDARPWTSEIAVPLVGYKPKYNLPVGGTAAAMAGLTAENLSQTAMVQKSAGTKARKEMWLATTDPGVDTVRAPAGMPASTYERPSQQQQQQVVLLQVRAAAISQTRHITHRAVCPLLLTRVTCICRGSSRIAIPCTRNPRCNGNSNLRGKSPHKTPGSMIQKRLERTSAGPRKPTIGAGSRADAEQRDRANQRLALAVSSRRPDDEAGPIGGVLSRSPDLDHGGA